VSVSEQERISHVVRRLSMGVHPDIVAGLDSTDGAIARALDLSVGAAPVPPAMEPPTSYDQQQPIDIVPWLEAGFRDCGLVFGRPSRVAVDVDFHFAINIRPPAVVGSLYHHVGTR